VKRAIYAVNGDTLRICVGKPDGKRPKSFESKGAGVWSEEWKRAK
jgi:hypothetical protein